VTCWERIRVSDFAIELLVSVHAFQMSLVLLATNVRRTTGKLLLEKGVNPAIAILWDLEVLNAIWYAQSI